MFPVIALALIILIGCSLIGWLFWKEKKQEKDETAPSEPQKDSKEPEVSAETLLARVGIAEERNPQKKSAAKPGLLDQLPFLKLFSKKKEESIVALAPDQISTGTASLRLDQITAQPIAPTTAPANKATVIDSATEASLRQDELEIKCHELTEKNQKLELFFKEKSEELEKSERNLANEIKNRKEFNKIKDILEKEIKDLKETNRDAQNTTTAAQTESQAYSKRITQLEEKINKLEKDMLKKEQDLNTALTDEKTYQQRISDLQDKLKKAEESIFEKNKKFEELIKRIKSDHKPEEIPPAPKAEEIPATPTAEESAAASAPTSEPKSEPTPETNPEPIAAEPTPAATLPEKILSKLIPPPLKEEAPKPEEPPVLTDIPKALEEPATPTGQGQPVPEPIAQTKDPASTIEPLQKITPPASIPELTINEISPTPEKPAITPEKTPESIDLPQKPAEESGEEGPQASLRSEKPKEIAPEKPQTVVPQKPLNLPDPEITSQETPDLPPQKNSEKASWPLTPPPSSTPMREKLPSKPKGDEPPHLAPDILKDRFKEELQGSLDEPKPDQEKDKRPD